MPATHNIDSELRLIITVWEGEATDSEFIEALIKYHNVIQSNSEYINYNEIVNLIKAVPMKLTTGGLLKIGSIASKAEKKIINKKMALVVGTDFAFNLANLYIFYRNIGIISRKKIRVFKSEGEAYSWVTSDA